MMLAQTHKLTMDSRHEGTTRGSEDNAPSRAETARYVRALLR